MWWLYNLETGEPYYKNEDYKNGCCFRNFHEFIFFTVLKARKNRQNNEH